jgi:hypothetical protein
VIIKPVPFINLIDYILSDRSIRFFLLSGQWNDIFIKFSRIFRACHRYRYHWLLAFQSELLESLSKMLMILQTNGKSWLTLLNYFRIVRRKLSQTDNGSSRIGVFAQGRLSLWCTGLDRLPGRDGRPSVQAQRIFSFSVILLPRGLAVGVGLKVSIS